MGRRARAVSDHFYFARALLWFPTTLADEIHLSSAQCFAAAQGPIHLDEEDDYFDEKEVPLSIRSETVLVEVDEPETKLR
jgi:hypothetical protein